MDDHLSQRRLGRTNQGKSNTHGREQLAPGKNKKRPSHVSEPFDQLIRHLGWNACPGLAAIPYIVIGIG